MSLRFVKCSNCGTRVVLTTDSVCPSCRQELPEANGVVSNESNLTARTDQAAPQEPTESSSATASGNSHNRNVQSQSQRNLAPGITLLVIGIGVMLLAIGRTVFYGVRMHEYSPAGCEDELKQQAGDDVAFTSIWYTGAEDLSVEYQGVSKKRHGRISGDEVSKLRDHLRREAEELMTASEVIMDKVLEEDVQLASKLTAILASLPRRVEDYLAEIEQTSLVLDYANKRGDAARRFKVGLWILPIGLAVTLSGLALFRTGKRRRKPTKA